MKIATIEDLPEILEMSKEFISKTGYEKYADEGQIENLIKTIVTGKQNEMIILLQPGVGFIAGQVSPFVFGPHLIASEIAWWVNEDKRKSGEGIELLNAFEYWAKHVAGCTMVTLASLDPKVGKIYEKKGYRLYERAYMKEI